MAGGGLAFAAGLSPLLAYNTITQGHPLAFTQGSEFRGFFQSAVGAPTGAHVRAVYTISAVVAGIAGGLLAETTQTVSLGTLDFQRSADLVVMLVLGGAGRLYGGLIGAIVFMVARDRFSGINPQYWYFWIGTLLVLVVTLLPNGILGGLARLRPGRAAGTPS